MALLVVRLGVPFLYLRLLSAIQLSLSLSVGRTGHRPRTMADQAALSSSSSSWISKPKCPCCAFLTDDMFLPPNLIMQTEEASLNEAHSSSGRIDPVEALQQISAASQETASNHADTLTNRQSAVLLVDTHGHAHLGRERHGSYINSETDDLNVPTVSLSCAVEESDWKKALEYASTSDSIIMGLGVHPWYLADLSDDWLGALEDLLVKHPSAIVGEIGLCKMARFVRCHPEGKQFALQEQRKVFKEQMRLASRLQRPVSVHCVKQHGVFMNVLKELVEEVDAFPPAIGMHSFTGTAHHVKEILEFERQHNFGGRRLFYFGFSHIVNCEMCNSQTSKRQGQEAVRAVPVDRIMAESDVHCANDVAVGTAGAVAYMADCLERPLLEVAHQTAVNGLAFLTTRSSNHKV